MVDNITSLTRHGLRDWLIQRVTSLLIGVYVVFLLIFLMAHPALDFDRWRELFTSSWMRISSFLVLLSIALHAWIGMWTVYTDYIKPAGWRLFIQLVTVLALLAYLIWGIEILWLV